MPQESEPQKVMKGGHLTSPTNIKKFAKERVKTLRPHWPMKQVSQEFLDACETHMRLFIEDRIRNHPTMGKTLTPP